MSATIRKIKTVVQPQPVIEGAGVRLKRSFPTRILDYPDPFLLLDHFGSDDPADYIAGFPMHPHRGIETVTYMKAGVVRHSDSLGNSGVIQAGDVQWMTAGRGILHEEMPGDVGGKMEGFQLWVNLPSHLKMMAPRYQEVKSTDIPEIDRKNKVHIRVIAGEVDGVTGPVREIAIEPTYLDVCLEQDAVLHFPAPATHTVLAYVYRGAGFFEEKSSDTEPIKEPKLVVFDDGDMLKVQVAEPPLCFLLIMGTPLHEPIVRYGPFVMNTQEEIQQTLLDLRNNKFITP